MSKSLLTSLTFLLFCLAPYLGQSQTGKYDVRLVENELDCDNKTMTFDIEVKANNAASTFNLADQNYRISFNRNAFRAYNVNVPESDRSVQIDSELTVSGFVTEGATGSFYDPHTLTGSTDTVLSYNVVLAGGDGYPVSDLNWVSVGRIAMEILDINACGDIWIHDNTPANFPNTFVGEKLSGVLFEAITGDLTDYSKCFPVVCVVNQAPVANNDYINTLEGNAITYPILFNDSDPENALDPNSITFLTVPPSNEGTVTKGATPGEIIITPAPGFVGDMTPFSYNVCDNQGLCTDATIYVTVDDDPSVGISDPVLAQLVDVFPTLAFQNVSISFENITASNEASIFLVDVQGRIVETYQKEVNGNPTHQFDVADLAPGNYFFKLIINEKVVVKRFIKY